MWLMNWPQVLLYVCLINKVDTLVFGLHFLDDVSVGEASRARSHFGYWCHGVLSKCVRYLHNMQHKESNAPKATAGWYIHAYVFDLKKLNFLNLPKFSFWRQRFGKVRILWKFIVDVHKNQSNGHNCVWSYFQKSLIVVVTLWKHEMMLYYDELYYIT